MGALTSVDLSVQFAGNSVDFRVEFIWQKIFTLLKTIHCGESPVTATTATVIPYREV